MAPKRSDELMVIDWRIDYAEALEAQMSTSSRVVGDHIALIWSYFT
jgi:hypothetical protein